MSAVRSFIFRLLVFLITAADVERVDSDHAGDDGDDGDASSHSAESNELSGGVIDNEDGENILPAPAEGHDAVSVNTNSYTSRCYRFCMLSVTAAQEMCRCGACHRWNSIEESQPLNPGTLAHDSQPQEQVIERSTPPVRRARLQARMGNFHPKPRTGENIPLLPLAPRVKPPEYCEVDPTPPPPLTYSTPPPTYSSPTPSSVSERNSGSEATTSGAGSRVFYTHGEQSSILRTPSDRSRGSDAPSSGSLSLEAPTSSRHTSYGSLTGGLGAAAAIRAELIPAPIGEVVEGTTRTIPLSLPITPILTVSSAVARTSGGGITRISPAGNTTTSEPSSEIQSLGGAQSGAVSTPSSGGSGSPLKRRAPTEVQFFGRYPKSGKSNPDSPDYPPCV